jgi:hypothetical protein
MIPYWICSSELIPLCPERSEAESKDPVELAFRIATGFLDFARNDSFSVLFPALLFPNQ